MSRSRIRSGGRRKGNCGRHCVVCHGPKVVYGESQERAAVRDRLQTMDAETDADVPASCAAGECDCDGTPDYLAGDAGPTKALTRKRG